MSGNTDQLAVSFEENMIRMFHDIPEEPLPFYERSSLEFLSRTLSMVRTPEISVLSSHLGMNVERAYDEIMAPLKRGVSHASETTYESILKPKRHYEDIWKD